MLRHIDRVVLRVPNLPSAIAYYRDVLGLRLVRQEATLASFAMADGPTELIIHTDEDQPTEQVYYLVDDVRDMYQRREELKLKFVAAPRAVGRGWRAVARDPFGIVLMLLDRTAGGDAAAIEDAKPAGMLFAGMEEPAPRRPDLLVHLYAETGRTADDLPYTPQFERIHAAYSQGQTDVKPTRAQTWRHLLNLRKAGKLPKLGEAKTAPPTLEPEDRERLLRLLGEEIGKRDRLPYSERFDALVDEFNRGRARALSPRVVWRLVARLAK